MRQTPESTNSNPKWRCCGKSCVSSVRACGEFRPIGDRSAPAWNAWRSCNCAPCTVGINRKRVATSWSPTTRSETGCAESTIAALVQTSTSVNRFPDVVRYAVRDSHKTLDHEPPNGGHDSFPAANGQSYSERFAERAQAFRTGRDRRKERGDRWRVEKGRVSLFGSPLSFLHSPALLPRSGNGDGREDSKRVSKLCTLLGPQSFHRHWFSLV